MSERLQNLHPLIQNGRAKYGNERSQGVPDRSNSFLHVCLLQRKQKQFILNLLNCKFSDLRAARSVFTVIQPGRYDLSRTLWSLLCFTVDQET